MCSCVVPTEIAKTTMTSVMEKAGRLTTEIVGLLKVEIIEAKDLPALDVGGTSDPFVKCKIVFFGKCSNF